jgi:hypothetical protein
MCCGQLKSSGRRRCGPKPPFSMELSGSELPPGPAPRARSSGTCSRRTPAPPIPASRSSRPRRGATRAPRTRAAARATPRRPGDRRRRAPMAEIFERVDGGPRLAQAAHRLVEVAVALGSLAGEPVEHEITRHRVVEVDELAIVVQRRREVEVARERAPPVVQLGHESLIRDGTAQQGPKPDVDGAARGGIRERGDGRAIDPHRLVRLHVLCVERHAADEEVLATTPHAR